MAVGGKLIALEGTDDEALERQAEDICRWLGDLGIAIERTREPTSGPVGVQVRLHDQGRLHFGPQSLALLLMADRLDHLEKEGGILATLEAGRHVLCVHYVLSAYARLYDQVPLDWHQQINARCRAPDLTVYIAPAGGDDPARDKHAGDYALAAQAVPEIREALEWIDASDQASAACRHRLSTLLSLGEA
jgi:thymidylate kinase